MGDTVTLPNASQPAPLAKKRPRLYLLFSPEAGITQGRAFSLTIGESHLGRRLTSGHEGITLAGDPALSAEHALVQVSEADYQVTLRDLSSKNGTWVGRRRLAANGTAAIVHDGEVIRLGGTFLLLRYEPAKSPDADIPSLLGVSLVVRELRARLCRLAPEAVPVLLFGESGTGKELAARALHQKSGRVGNLIVRNCAAIPVNLIESELFGHTANAFTGATARTGAFRSADGGTLFLDEIGELPLDLQARLLRVVEEGQVTPVGSDRSLACQARLVTATNRDLSAAAAGGKFRGDLRARLAHVVVEMPPLRGRREDILLLLRHFYPEIGRHLTEDLVHNLLTSDWLDNIRGLRSVADRLRIDGDTESLRRDLIGPEPPQVEVSLATDAPATAARPYRLPVPPREQLIELLKQHLGTVQRVADDLGCSRRQAQRWLEQYELDASDFRKPRP